MDRRRVVAGFAVAVAVLVAFVAGFGVDRVGRALGGADLAAYAPAPVATLVGLSLGAASLSRLVRRVEGAPRGRAFVGGYATGVLLRGLAPWGRGGGSVLFAAAIDRRGTSRFEEVLGAAVTGEFLGAAASAVVGVVGIATLAATGGGGDVVGVAVVLGVAVAALAAGAGVVLSYPVVLVRGVELGLLAIRGTVGRVWSPVDRALDRADVGARTDRFVRTVRAVVRDPATIGPVMVLVQTAAFVAVVPMWASLRAVGEPVALPVLLVLVPLTGLAAVVPLPGGTGGVEFALAGLLVAATDTPAAAAAAAVLLYRLATYWLGLGVAAAVTVALSGGVSLSEYPTR